MNLEGIILSEISQSKTNTIDTWSHLYVYSKKQNKPLDAENKRVVVRKERGRGVGEIGGD